MADMEVEAPKIAARNAAIKLSTPSRKWGSCSAAGEVTLAEDLAQMGERFQDWVIVHELLHLQTSPRPSPSPRRRFRCAKAPGCAIHPLTGPLYPT